ncbi:YabP/YqfC family sporulation protein [[Clostridium] fimetarium]|uniref:Sporulation protein YqfC n=1 Tax=[Clostridium] fimetarium TaxID=99656 RepID=A0A1I0QKG0_9FIRM|nr:YabP/YqfC family sporulation protein [[Clostridium] fimetarium]SEW27538.1 sporulation protein YqfC [[Clostridium] fimetarium]
MGIVNALNLPKDVVLGMPVITATGNCEVHIENFKSIMEYNCDCVKLMTKKGPIKITGSRLVIDYFNSEEIHITGIIKCIEL